LLANGEQARAKKIFAGLLTNPDRETKLDFTFGSDAPRAMLTD
jgi:hypothetical protein